MSLQFVITLLAVLAMMLAPSTVLAEKGRGGPSTTVDSPVTSNLPESNAEGLVILSNYYPGLLVGPTPI